METGEILAEKTNKGKPAPKVGDILRQRSDERKVPYQ